MLSKELLEYIPIAVSLVGAIGTFFSLLWVKTVKPIIQLIKDHEHVNDSIKTIKSELTTNGGNSLKDAIIDLKKTCHRIEIRQKIIEQRTKAGLHYSNTPLFETDNNGRLIWNNSLFFDFVGFHNVEGYDWLNFIQEEDREELLKEFQSCLQTNRQFYKETRTSEGKDINIIGFPYRISDNEHGGFLVSITNKKEV
jgi:PAS domain S-box-containing protein